MSGSDSSERELEELQRRVARARRRLEKERLRNELLQIEMELAQEEAIGSPSSAGSSKRSPSRVLVAPSSTRGVEATTTEGIRTRKPKETKKAKVLSKTVKESDAKELSHEHSFDDEKKAKEWAKANNSVYPFRRWGR